MGNRTRTLRKKHGKTYENHRSNLSVHKLVRNYVKSHLNYHKYDQEAIEDFIYPKKYAYTYTWWDVRPGSPAVFKNK